MTDTKRIILWLAVVIWGIAALAFPVRAQELASIQFEEPKCSERIELAHAIPVHKKLGTSHRVTGDYGGFGGPTAAAAGGESETADFKWNGEHPSGTEYAYIAQDTGSRQGTLSGAAVSTAQAYSPTHSLLLDGDDENLNFPISTSDIYNTAQGYMSFRIYITTLPSATHNVDIMELEADTMPYTFLSTNGTITFLYKADGTPVTSGALSTGEWHFVEIRWDTTQAGDADRTEIRIDEGIWTVETGTFAASPAGTLLRIGRYNQYFTPYGSLLYIDDFRVWTSYDKS